MGSLASGGVVSAFGAVFVNDSTSTFKNVSISFIGEQWRTTTAAANTLAFSYGVGANDIFDTADLTNDSSLNFTSVVVASDGRAQRQRPCESGECKRHDWRLRLGAGQRLVIRWADANEAGSDHGLAIDNFTFNAFGTILTWNPTGGTPAAWNTTDTDNWLDGATPSAFTTGDTVMFSDVGAGTVNINAAGVSPGSVRVETDNFYFFNGGAINSSGGLTKERIGTLTLQNANTYAGPVAVNGGALRLDGAARSRRPASR